MKISKSNPKQFWKKVKCQYKKKQKLAQTLNIEDLYEHFNDLYTCDDDDNITNNSNNNDIGNNEDLTDDIIFYEDLDAEITITELKDAVFSQSNNKSTGLDHICAEIYKHSLDKTSLFILKLFNRLLTQGEYPSCFAEGIICPIFKGGNIEDDKNYRSITLNNVLAKIYSQLLSNRLTK